MFEKFKLHQRSFEDVEREAKYHEDARYMSGEANFKVFPIAQIAARFISNESLSLAFPEFATHIIKYKMKFLH